MFKAIYTVQEKHTRWGVAFQVAHGCLISLTMTNRILLYLLEECFERAVIGWRISVPHERVIDPLHTQIGNACRASLRKEIRRNHRNLGIGSSMKEQCWDG